MMDLVFIVSCFVLKNKMMKTVKHSFAVLILHRILILRSKQGLPDYIKIVIGFIVEIQSNDNMQLVFKTHILKRYSQFGFQIIVRPSELLHKMLMYSFLEKKGLSIRSKIVLSIHLTISRIYHPCHRRVEEKVGLVISCYLCNWFYFHDV